MNIREFKSYAKARLEKDREAPEIRVVISSLLAKFAGIPHYWYHTQEDHVLSAGAENALLEAVSQAAAGRPLQYILGYVTFGECRIAVNEQVLIPRPETEELWNRAKQLEGDILDACTGSGCLAVALKKATPIKTVFAFDISSGALELAQKNAADNQTDVFFFQADLTDLKGFDKAALGAGLKKNSLGLITANPPYVTEKEKPGMSDGVLSFEPHQALFVPDRDPLLFYKPLASVGRMYLKKGGVLFAEINEMYGHEISLLMREAGYTDVRIHKDLFEKNRFVEAKWIQ
ncbi:MAG: peptide chain release factor N(5)-glutamine methyltransferase [Bacteroidales bacterium]|nr:peptide chain release factor N(5)-glutamine methyltransferase [Bacteroidales bacterium]